MSSQPQLTRADEIELELRGRLTRLEHRLWSAQMSIALLTLATLAIAAAVAITEGARDAH